MAKSNKKAESSTASKVAKIDPFFVEEVMSMPLEQLKDKIVNMAKLKQELDEAKQNDLDLQKLKEQVKVAGEVYSEQNKAIKLKTKLILEIMAARGK